MRGTGYRTTQLTRPRKTTVTIFFGSWALGWGCFQPYSLPSPACGGTPAGPDPRNSALQNSTNHTSPGYENLLYSQSDLPPISNEETGQDIQGTDGPTVNSQGHVTSRLVPAEFLPHLERVQVE